MSEQEVKAMFEKAKKVPREVADRLEGLAKGYESDDKPRHGYAEDMRLAAAATKLLVSDAPQPKEVMPNAGANDSGSTALHAAPGAAHPTNADRERAPNLDVHLADDFPRLDEAAAAIRAREGK